MASLADQYGGRAGLVAFSQTLRIAVGAIPGPLIAAAHVALEISLGAMFDRSIIRSADRFGHGAAVANGASAARPADREALAAVRLISPPPPFRLLIPFDLRPSRALRPGPAAVTVDIRLGELGPEEKYL